MSGFTQVAIRAENLGKTYRIWADPAARLKYPLWKAITGPLPDFLKPQSLKSGGITSPYFRDFEALGGVSFEVARGEALGIVGRNGSGKSTLLQMIAGTLTPTSGTVTTKGRVAALLELGSGFNPEFTGRENVYIYASVLGLTNTEVDSKFASISEFAEIGEFIDQPVRTYSSGMVVRLGFAVASQVNPDILIVDEALSVGDARFQLKCARAIDRFLENGTTLLFVSHDTSAVKRLCNKAILLDRGRVVYHGSPNDVTNLYSKLLAEGSVTESLKADIERLRTSGEEIGSKADDSRLYPTNEQQSESAWPIERQEELRLKIAALEIAMRAHENSQEMEKKVSTIMAEERSNIKVTGNEYSYGGELGRITDIAVVDRHGLSRLTYSSGEEVVVRCRYEAFETFQDPIFALTIKSASGVEIYGTNTLFSNQPAQPLARGEARVVEFSFALNLMAGNYFLSLGFTHFFGDELAVIHRRYDAIKLELHSVDKTFGIANLHAKIRELRSARTAL